MNNRSIEMLKTALDMETKGRKFYEEAIKKCSNDLGKQIFTTLMNDEIIHAERIKKIYDALNAGKGWSEDWKVLQFDHPKINILFRGLAKKEGKNIKASTGDIEALDVGLSLEQRSITFYKDSLKTATDPIEKSFIDRMIIEENGHWDALTDMKFYLTNPEAWFTEQERHGLDGA